jgi:hypothetical protein
MRGSLLWQPELIHHPSSTFPPFNFFSRISEFSSLSDPLSYQAMKENMLNRDTDHFPISHLCSKFEHQNMYNAKRKQIKYVLSLY